jgi:hypothetical protein
MRKFHALHKFCKKRRRSPRGYIECVSTTHFIADCPKRKKLDSSKKYDYSNRNDSSDRVTRRRRRSFKRSCPEHVLLSVTSTSSATTPYWRS